MNAGTEHTLTFLAHTVVSLATVSSHLQHCGRQHSRFTSCTQGMYWSYQAFCRTSKDEIRPPSTHLFPFPTLAFSTCTKHVSHSPSTICCVLSAMSPQGPAALSGCAVSHMLIRESSSYWETQPHLGTATCSSVLFIYISGCPASYFNLHLDDLFFSSLKKTEDLCYMPINSS